MRLIPSLLALTLASTALAQPGGGGDKVDPVRATQPKSTSTEGAIVVQPEGVLDAATRAKGEQVAAKAIAYLKAQQDAASGGWSVPTKPGKPNLPAISGLILNGILLDHGTKADDPAVAKGVSYILRFQQPDGGIYDAILPTYNTSIAISALAHVDTDAARDAIVKGQNFLRNSQWGAAAPVGGKETPQGADKVTPAHPFYGGLGYGNHGRPDISNTGFFLQTMHDTGVPSDDPAVQRALVFLQRLQMLEKDSSGKIVNDQPYAKDSRQGGFIYATTEEAKDLNIGQSEASTKVEETLDDGTKISRLRAYGSVSYDGFKSYLYAGLKQSDPRVQAVLGFMRRNYTVAENPGMGSDGLYYYYLMFARALEAGKINTMDAVTTDASGKKTTVPHNWRADLINRLAELQNPDGSFKSVNPRWMEDNPQLITGYGLIALEHALK
jgi:squalene-hopene/tetraprenyl-beta-curcumene cyclase